MVFLEAKHHAVQIIIRFKQLVNRPALFTHLLQECPFNSLFNFLYLFVMVCQDQFFRLILRLNFELGAIYVTGVQINWLRASFDSHTIDLSHIILSL